MCAELANLNDCAVPFLSRAVVNLFWYYYISVCTIASLKTWQNVLLKRTHKISVDDC